MVSESKKCEDHVNCEGFDSKFCTDASITKMCPKLCDACENYWDDWTEWSECSTSCRGTANQEK